MPENVLKSSARSILNVALRGLTIGSKAVLVFYMARALPVEQVGIYGLMTSTISISVYLLGLDFYTFNTREIVAANLERQVILIRDQFVFHLAFYVIALPLLALVFVIGLLPVTLAIWFYLLCMFQHVCQEFCRVLVALGKPIIANLGLLLSGGLWALTLGGLGILVPSWKPGLTEIWSGWLIGLSLCIAISCLAIKAMPWTTVFHPRPDVAWVKKGLRISFPFLISSAALLATRNVDRYFLQYFSGEVAVGVYSFYSNLVVVIEVLISSGVVVFFFPALLRSYQNSDRGLYDRLLAKMSCSIILVSLCGGIFLCVAIKPLLAIVGRDVYANHLDSYYIMVLAAIIASLANIPHYILYVQRKDKIIMAGSVGALCVNVVANMLLVPSLGIYGAAWASTISLGTMAVFNSCNLLYQRVNSAASLNLDPEGESPAPGTDC